MEIGFIGLGRMGAGMAGSLLAAGHALTVHNRTPGRDAALVARGARGAKTPADACRGEVVVTMLSDDAAVEQVVFGEGGMLATLKPGALHISCTTIGMGLAQMLARRHGEARQRFVSAPVFGRPEAAAAAKLFVVAAGDAEAIRAAQPVFDALGQRTFVVSERAEAASLVKLAGNFLLAAMIESLGEAFALVGKGGVAPEAFLELITSTLFNVPVYKNYGALIASGRFEPAGFAAPLGHKDIRLALAAGEALRVPLPLASLLRDRFLALLAQGGEKLDWAAIGALPARDAAAR